MTASRRIREIAAERERYREDAHDLQRIVATMVRERDEAVAELDRINQAWVAAQNEYAKRILSMESMLESLYAMTQAMLAAKEEYGEEYIANLPHVRLAVPEDIQSLIDTYEALVAKYGEEGIKKYPLSLAGSTDIFEVIIKSVDLKDKAYTQCPEMIIDRTRKYFATLSTTQGDIVIELYPDKAPTTVNSFVFLAKEGWFNNIDFHRVIPGFIAQTGDPSGTGLGSPGYAFGNEANDLLYDGPGVVGMANSGPDTNGSQFFITYDALPQLDGGYTIFGKVVEGMDNLMKLTAIDPQQDTGAKPDVLLSVTIEEK